MPSPGAVQALVLAFQVVLTCYAPGHAQSSPRALTAPTAAPAPSPGGPTLDLPCCFSSAQNATSLGPVVVLRRDDEKPSMLAMMMAAAATGTGADPTWEATLRRAATRALTWDGLNDAPFVASHHSAEVLAALDEPSDIRVLARGLLVAGRDGRPVFRETDLPGERCVDCPADVPGPNGESIKAMWSVRRIRHSGPNADHRPCYELQFSVTPIVPALPPLSRWVPPGPGAAQAVSLLGPAIDVPDWRAGLRAESRVSRQRELRPKGLILRVNPIPDPLQHLDVSPGVSPGVSPAYSTPHTDSGVAVALATTIGSTLGTTLGSTLGTPVVSVLANDPRRVHEHLHHHFYVRNGLTEYAGSTTETEFPTATQPFRASPQFHEYSQPDPLFHPPPGSRPSSPHPRPRPTAPRPTTTRQSSQQPAYPNSINEQLPPVRDGSDTRVPYVSATKQTGVPSVPTLRPAMSSTPAPSLAPRPSPRPRPSTRPTTMRFPVEEEVGPTVTMVSSLRPTTITTRVPNSWQSTRTSVGTVPTVENTQVYRITGGYSFTTATPTGSRRPHKATNKHKTTKQTYYEIGRPTKAFSTTTVEEAWEDATTTLRPEVTSSEFLSEYPAATIRGTTSTGTNPTSSSRIPLFTPVYAGKEFEMSILKVMTSKVPSYIDIFTENGVRVTTIRPTESQDSASNGSVRDISNRNTTPVTSDTRLFKENPYRGPYSLIINSSKSENTLTHGQKQKLSTTLQTRQPHSIETVTPSLETDEHSPHVNNAVSSTPSSPLQITFFVATEDESKQPSASTLISDPFRQDDATTYQYTILRSVKQSIDVMRHENETANEALGTSTEPISITRRIFTTRDEQLLKNRDEDSFSDKSEHQVKNIPESRVNGHTNHRNIKAKNTTETYSQILKNLTQNTETTTRRPWRPSTRRPWRQRSSYKQYYSKRKGLNATTTESPLDPTSIVEIRKTYSVTASRKRKPSGYQGKSYLKNQKLHRRKEEQLDNSNQALSTKTNSDPAAAQGHRQSGQGEEFLRTASGHSSLL